ncbi:uncharacterized protein LTR77_004369 [Saxophila tyrrhenica]|uniref:Uncharacterized protein n=1 Tax=Saxophila tyrrhenica TaxID=1690608 RepID=A0AAV9PD99_9PEZI|nr:hypothetical protein LTR77_004369 [Saxophila tyrrhenica]
MTRPRAAVCYPCTAEGNHDVSGHHDHAEGDPEKTRKLTYLVSQCDMNARYPQQCTRCFEKNRRRTAPPYLTCDPTRTTIAEFQASKAANLARERKRTAYQQQQQTYQQNQQTQQGYQFMPSMQHIPFAQPYPVNPAYQPANFTPQNFVPITYNFVPSQVPSNHGLHFFSGNMGGAPLPPPPPPLTLSTNKNSTKQRKRRAQLGALKAASQANQYGQPPPQQGMGQSPQQGMAQPPQSMGQQSYQSMAAPTNSYANWRPACRGTDSLEEQKLLQQQAAELKLRRIQAQLADETNADSRNRHDQQRHIRNAQGRTHIGSESCSSTNFGNRDGSLRPTLRGHHVEYTGTSDAESGITVLEGPEGRNRYGGARMRGSDLSIGNPSHFRNNGNNFNARPDNASSSGAQMNNNTLKRPEFQPAANTAAQNNNVSARPEHHADPRNVKLPDGNNRNNRLELQPPSTSAGLNNNVNARPKHPAEPSCSNQRVGNDSLNRPGIRPAMSSGGPNINVNARPEFHVDPSPSPRPAPPHPVMK